MLGVRKYHEKKNVFDGKIYPNEIISPSQIFRYIPCKKYLPPVQFPSSQKISSTNKLLYGCHAWRPEIPVRKMFLMANPYNDFPSLYTKNIFHLSIPFIAKNIFY